MPVDDPRQDVGEVGKRVDVVELVHLAALKAICQYLVDEDKLTVNPVAGVVVRNVETERDDDEKGFSDKDARTILAATLQEGCRATPLGLWMQNLWMLFHYSLNFREISEPSLDSRWNVRAFRFNSRRLRMRP